MPCLITSATFWIPRRLSLLTNQNKSKFKHITPIILKNYTDFLSNNALTTNLVFFVQNSSNWATYIMSTIVLFLFTRSSDSSVLFIPYIRISLKAFSVVAPRLWSLELLSDTRNSLSRSTVGSKHLCAIMTSYSWHSAYANLTLTLATSSIPTPMYLLNYPLWCLELSLTKYGSLTKYWPIPITKYGMIPTYEVLNDP